MQPVPARNNPPMRSIAIEPSSASLAVGKKHKFTATGKPARIDKADKAVAEHDIDITDVVNWKTSDKSVATIDRGLVTAVKEGHVKVTATYKSESEEVKQATAELKVEPPVVEQISILPANPSVVLGEKEQLKAVATISDGSMRDVTAAAVWKSSDPKVAAITAPGEATSMGQGSCQITAHYKGSQQVAMLTVTAPVVRSIAVSPVSPSIPVGRTQQFAATGTFSDKTTSDMSTSVAWNSSNPSVATVNAAGLATALAQGTSTITAQSGGVSSGPAAITVTPPAVVSLDVSAPSLFVGAGSTRQFTATALYTDGKLVDVTSQSAWSSSNSQIVTVSSAGGLATGVNAGQAAVTAMYTAGVSVFTDPTPPVLTVLVTFTNLADADNHAFANAKNSVNQLLTAFKRRGNLSDNEVAQLRDALELVTQFVNNNPGTPIPNFNASGHGDQSDLARLGIPFNTDPSQGKIGTGSGKAFVIDDRFRAIAAYLFPTPPPAPGIEHDPGSFPGGAGPNPGGLTDDQLRIAGVYGYVANRPAVPPQYRPVTLSITPDDQNRRAQFNQFVEGANAHFGTNRALYVATLSRLLQVSQSPQLSGNTWAKVAELLVRQGVSPYDPQLNLQIDRALDTAQNVGQAAEPSEININLPDLEQDISNFEIIKDNIFALQPAYFASMLEELKVFQVVDKLVELFQNGILPVVKGDAGNLLFAYWKSAALRVSEAERRGFYARTLGMPGGDADSPNREFKDLFMRFVSAVSSFVRQNTLDNLLRANIPGAISQQQVRKSGRDLATNISSHGYGIAYPMATELQKEINDVMAILKNSEIQDAYGAKDLWQLVDQVAGLELGGAKNSVKYRTMASAGATIFAWLANKSGELSTNSYLPILEVGQIQNPVAQSTKPTVNPSDFDLVGACDQWLAVTGTQEDSVEKMAQPTEAPAMPSRPIQIPAIAREMLESVGVPAMSFSAFKPNGQASWRRY